MTRGLQRLRRDRRIGLPEKDKLHEWVTILAGQNIREPSTIAAVLDRALAFAKRSGPWRSWTFLTIQIQLAAEQLGASMISPAPSVPPPATVLEKEPPSAWAAAKARIRAQIPEIAFLNWFESTRQVERSGAVITVAVPDAPTAAYVASEYEFVIQDAASSEGIGEVRFVVQTEANVTNVSVAHRGIGCRPIATVVAGMEVGPTGPADLRPAPVAVIPSESIIPGTLG